MKEYKREYPIFSLCGLNCGLCPRYHTDGQSKCPGCGGEDFHLKHPACAVITCNKKHDKEEFCFQCSSYPCEKYRNPSTVDSFISYQNVITDFEKAQQVGMEQYILELKQKVDILEYLLENYNDGRNKNFYCIAVNLLGLDELKYIKIEIANELSNLDIPLENKIKQIKTLFEEQADKNRIKLELRK